MALYGCFLIIICRFILHSILNGLLVMSYAIDFIVNIYFA